MEGRRIKTTLFEELKGGLIVSCQALENEPLHSSLIMARMALAAKEGGAIAIRANGHSDILEIKRVTNLPIIGIVKREYPTSDVYITPTITEVEEIVSAGADIVAVDLTNRKRPDGKGPKDFMEAIRRKFPNIRVMADISTVEEGRMAEALGADLVATTLSGYTPYSPQHPEPDFQLIERLAPLLKIPLIAEGRIQTPEAAALCLEKGAWAVVVGSAITRPQMITKMFAEEIKKVKQKGEGGGIGV